MARINLRLMSMLLIALVASACTGESKPLPEQNEKTYVIDADDYGFYINEQPISSLSLIKGEKTKVTFNVKQQNVYFAGLDFRGCDLNTGKIDPGSSTTIDITPTESCAITSYWPATNDIKATLAIEIR